jgi:hypothetical protein
VLDSRPAIVALANSWIIINTGGGPTDDKPTVMLEAPTDPDRVSAFLTIRVADIDTICRHRPSAAQRSSPHRSNTPAKSAVTYATPTGTSPRLAS